MLRTEGSQERLDNLAELKQSVYDYEISCGEEKTIFEAKRLDTFSKPGYGDVPRLTLGK